MLNIALTSKLLVNNREANEKYDHYLTEGKEEEGKIIYEQDMAERLTQKQYLRAGPMLPLVRAFQQTGLVNFFVVSKIGPESGKLVSASLQHHGIDIPAEHQIYKNGYEAFTEAKKFQPHAYFSCNEKDVADALRQEIPSAYLVPIDYSRRPIGNEIIIASDFDGIIASDSSDIFFSEAEAQAKKLNRSKEELLDIVRSYEEINQDNILPAGPFAPFIKTLSDLRKKLKENPEGIQIKLVVVTARCGRCGPRAVNTLKHFGIEIDHIELRDGADKGEYIKSIGAHLFFDDSLRHVKNAAKAGVLAGHVPAPGIVNQHFVPAPKKTLYFNPRSPSPSPQLRATESEPGQIANFTLD